MFEKYYYDKKSVAHSNKPTLDTRVASQLDDEFVDLIGNNFEEENSQIESDA